MAILAEQRVRGNHKSNELLEKEWLLTNRRGGFSSGTLSCCNTRRYHSILTGAVNPPAGRINGLNCINDSIIIQDRKYNLSNFQFSKEQLSDDVILPCSFYQDSGVHFEYKIEDFTIIKSIYLSLETDRAAITYKFPQLTQEMDLEIRPFAAIRDFHSLTKSNRLFCCNWQDGELVIGDKENISTKLHLASEKMIFNEDNSWWYNFYYSADDMRGQDCLEDLWSPGTFQYHINCCDEVVFWAGLYQDNPPDRLIDLDIDIVRDDIELEQKRILKKSKAIDSNQKKLYIAADKFIVQRNLFDKQTSTIVAGFPWFLDWGRDTFISLKGLLLETGRFEEAKEVLSVFASAINKGIIPNRFDDYTNAPHYNSIDASLWFIKGCFDYLQASGDNQTFLTVLLPSIKWIVEGYYNGTDFNIHADADGLIMGGSEQTQLTWMDAKSNGVVFTPRYGKAVEINALWHNAISCLADFYKTKNPDSQEYEHFNSLADEVEDSFRKVFWNEKDKCLYDCVLPNGFEDPSIRPNQIFAVSLKHSPLSLQQQEAVVDKVEQHLFTPFGLRTLSPEDNRYHPRYEGTMFQRDSAYHQGTVWPWLMGPFIKAFLRVNNYSQSSKNWAMDLLQPLLTHFKEQGCINSVCEVFDGDPPQKPNGCFAQAWSVAQLIEAYNLAL